MSKADAIEAARSRELDLVLIAAKSDPPVCKIVSYDKFRFNKEKKQKDQKWPRISNGRTCRGIDRRRTYI